MPFPRVWSPSHAVLEPTVNLSQCTRIYDIRDRLKNYQRHQILGFVNPYVIIVTKVWYTRYILSHAPRTYNRSCEMPDITSTQNTKIWGYDHLWRMLYTNTIHGNLSLYSMYEIWIIFSESPFILKSPQLLWQFRSSAIYKRLENSFKQLNPRRAACDKKCKKILRLLWWWWFNLLMGDFGVWKRTGLRLGLDSKDFQTQILALACFLIFISQSSYHQIIDLIFPSDPYDEMPIWF